MNTSALTVNTGTLATVCGLPIQVPAMNVHNTAVYYADTHTIILTHTV